MCADNRMIAPFYSAVQRKSEGIVAKLPGWAPQRDAGIALGTGAPDIAVQAAPVILMGLSVIGNSLRLGRRLAR